MVASVDGPDAFNATGTSKFPQELVRGSNVRVGSQADICAAISLVRFAPNSDRKSRHAANGHVRFGPIAYIDRALFNYFVGLSEQRGL